MTHSKISFVMKMTGRNKKKYS